MYNYKISGTYIGSRSQKGHEMVNKQGMLIRNIVSKVVNDFCMGLKILFEVRSGGLPFSTLPYVRGFFNLYSKLY